MMIEQVQLNTFILQALLQLSQPRRLSCINNNQPGNRFDINIFQTFDCKRNAKLLGKVVTHNFFL